MGNNKYKVLIVEDDQSILGFVQTILETNGYQVLTAERCRQGLLIFSSYTPDLVVLDLGLPDMDGGEFIRQVRLFSTVPIIVLSARTEENDKVSALDLGANDYITKPFSMPLVVKHIEAVLRRAEQGAGVETNILRYKDLTLDTDSFTILVKDESVSLTIREFEILKLLVENQGRVFTRESLLDSIWGYDYFGDEKIVNTHIKNIRKKLGVDYIETIRGAGYKIEKEN